MTVRAIIGKAWLGGSETTPVRVRYAQGKIESVERGIFADHDPETLRLSHEQVLLPGFHDAHLHLLTGGLQMAQIDLGGAHTTDQVLERISDFVSREKPLAGTWLLGHGLEQTEVSVTRLDLDRVASTHPIFLWTHDLHSVIVNSAALIAARVDGSSRDPEGGRFERGADGKLNGIARESAAYLIRSHIPEPDAEQCRLAFRRAQQFAHSLGITAASASVRSDLLPQYLDLADSVDQTIRLNIWKVTTDFDFEADRFEFRHSEMFRFACFKGFTDGALGSRTASFWQPYADDPANSGTLLVREGPLARFVRAAHQQGAQIAMHAIGDRANSVVLDAVEMASCNGIGPELRPRIEHCQHLRERDIGRFAKLGVVASMQPIHCTADMSFVKGRLGEERERYSYAWNSLKKAGAMLAFGSDWPIEDMSPMAGVHAAVTRTRKDRTPEGGYYPDECVSVEDALTAYTMGAAYAAGWEELLGSIEAGKAADFCVLDADPFQTRVQDLHLLRSVMTLVAGETVYSSDSA
ncbi:MAG: amidohydrolase [Calditrichaeota bacterium]|nr:amidohydrolase [Calditrichota bacterium]MCB9366331.1 amidohydrolase [Calditrichota bacterium]